MLGNISGLLSRLSETLGSLDSQRSQTLPHETTSNLDCWMIYHRVELHRHLPSSDAHPSIHSASRCLVGSCGL
jgi:hypothetical protein